MGDERRLLVVADHSVEDPTPLSVDHLARDAWGVVDRADPDLRVLDDPVVSGDRSRVRQLLENLFRNALEHGSTDSQTNAGDAVTVEVGALDAGGFYVADDGPGIPPEKREAVLQSGVSESGTGLGLAIVQRIVEAHGWSLSITESDAGGARIEILAS